jgi:DNA invertase Pin-like site-specific DNA recombinase
VAVERQAGRGLREVAGSAGRPNVGGAPALAYLRTSSSTNVGAEKDSDKRQRIAIEAFARHGGFEIVAEFYDQAVSGADPIEGRPGFAQMLEHIAGNGARTIVVETANRFARDLIVQQTGHRMLKERGIEIIAADIPSAFVDDTPTTTFVRQVLGAVAQLDKAMTVAKLRGARERKRRQVGLCEGGAPLHERYPEAVRMAKRLHRANPVTGKRRSLRKIATELAGAGHLTEAKYRGCKVARPFNPGTIKAMIEGPAPSALKPRSVS